MGGGGVVGCVGWFAAARVGMRRAAGASAPAIADPPPPCLLPRPCPAGLLSDNNRLTELSRIVGKFEEIAADQRGEVKAVVTTAEVRASG